MVLMRMLGLRVYALSRRGTGTKCRGRMLTDKPTQVAQVTKDICLQLWFIKTLRNLSSFWLQMTPADIAVLMQSVFLDTVCARKVTMETARHAEVSECSKIWHVAIHFYPWHRRRNNSKLFDWWFSSYTLQPWIIIFVFYGCKYLFRF